MESVKDMGLFVCILTLKDENTKTNSEPFKCTGSRTEWMRHSPVVKKSS